MESVVVYLRDATEAELVVFLRIKYPFQNGPPWIYEANGDPSLYIRIDDGGIPKWERECAVKALGKEPATTVYADVSGRHIDEGHATDFVLTMLRRFSGVATDGYTDHAWTAEEIQSGVKVEGHGFFDYLGWYHEYKAKGEL